MAGLMGLFSRHSGLWTNFKDIIPESRPYWLQEGMYGVREPRVCGGPSRAWSARGDAVALVLVLVGPWQYQSGGWLGSTRYTHPPSTTQLPHPGYSPRLPQVLYPDSRVVWCPGSMHT